MSKVLVTGGLGFIGSNIVDLLVEKGYEVVIVDNMSTGSKKNMNRKAKFYPKDICNGDLMNVFKKEKPEYVVHEAAQINVRKSFSDPLFDAGVNVIGSVNLLECCRKTGVRKVIYASSGGAIYGEPEHIPADEKHAIRPMSPYGASKYTVEKYLSIYKNNYDIDYVSLRYANVYGPRQDPEGEAGVISIFIKKLLGSISPIIYGDGEQTRDFVYVKDVARANLKALETATPGTEYNIGTGVETSVNKLFEKIKEATGSSENAFHGKAASGEVRRISLDIRLAGKELGWKPEKTLDAGLKETVEWFRKQA